MQGYIFSNTELLNFVKVHLFLGLCVCVCLSERERGTFRTVLGVLMIDNVDHRQASLPFLFHVLW